MKNDRNRLSHHKVDCGCPLLQARVPCGYLTSKGLDGLTSPVLQFLRDVQFITCARVDQLPLFPYNRG